MNFLRRLSRLDMALAAGIVISLSALAGSLYFLSSADSRFQKSIQRERDIQALTDDYMPIKRRVAALEGRKNLTKVSGIVDAVDKVFEPIGLKGRVKSVKPLGAKEASEEKAEVSIEGVDMNEMVNILYKIEYAPMLLVVRKISLSTSFENPKLLNITMTLSLITG